MASLHLGLRFFRCTLNVTSSVTLGVGRTARRCGSRVVPPFAGTLFGCIRRNGCAFYAPNRVNNATFRGDPTNDVFCSFCNPGTFGTSMSVSVPRLNSLLSRSNPRGRTRRCVTHAFGTSDSCVMAGNASASGGVMNVFSTPTNDAMLVSHGYRGSLARVVVVDSMAPVCFHPAHGTCNVLNNVPRDRFAHRIVRTGMTTAPGTAVPNCTIVAGSACSNLLCGARCVGRALSAGFVRFSDT